MANKKGSVLSVQSESLNEMGAKKAQEVTLKFATEIAEIRQNKNYRGTRPFVFGTLSGFLNQEI